jgi:hypothetical protein
MVRKKGHSRRARSSRRSEWLSEGVNLEVVLGVSSPARAEIFIALTRVARNPFLSDRSRCLMDGRQERVLVSTHALVATDGVRFRTISGAAAEAIYEKPDRQTSSIVSLEQSRKAAVTTADHLPSRVHNHPFTQRPCRSTRAGAPPMSQHLPAQRPVYTAIPRYCRHNNYLTRVISENPDIVRAARGRIESTAYITILEVTGVNPVSTKILGSSAQYYEVFLTEFSL